MVNDSEVIGVGGNATLQVLAEVEGYGSADDGLFSYDINAFFDAPGIVQIVPGSVSQPGSETPMSGGAAGAAGLTKCYGTYFYEQGYGIGGPKELVSFDIMGLSPGTVTITVTPDVTIGADFLLQESSIFTVDYSAASITLTVAGPGDANGDGVVDAADYIVLKQNFGTASGAAWTGGDFNGNGSVDRDDLAILAGNMGNAYAAPSTTGGSISAPEPAGLSLLAMVGLGLLRRRR